jgi:hypothetical protein
LAKGLLDAAAKSEDPAARYVALIRQQEAKALEYALDCKYNVCVPAEIGRSSVKWFVIG